MSAPSISAVIDHVALHHHISRQQIIGSSRTQQLVGPRQLVMYLAFMRGHSAAAIGRVLRRDHTTVLAGTKRVRERVAASASDRAAVEMLGREIDGPLGAIGSDQLSKDAAEALLIELVGLALRRGRAAITRDPAQALRALALAFGDAKP